MSIFGVRTRLILVLDLISTITHSNPCLEQLCDLGIQYARDNEEQHFANGLHCCSNNFFY